ncbi:uncharacterized protein LOC143245933 [Tachypleus tridentatus]|uniref:uncharacterized protein LOC143245933 n=1 Tax=Tachypleus tridentatus TaxID=6853 RepID=UPI003FD668B0
MVCNTMFYGINVYDTEDQLEIWKFSVSSSHVITGIESSLIAFMVNVLIITLFRNVSPCPDQSVKQDQMKSEVNPSLNEESRPVMLEENVSGPSSVTEQIPVITDIQNISESVSNETTKLQTGNSSSYQWWFGQDKHSIKSAHRSFWENHGNEECSLPQGCCLDLSDQFILYRTVWVNIWLQTKFGWLLSVVTAVFHSLIIIQPLMSVTYAILLAWMVKKPPVLMDRNDNTALERGEAYVSSSVQQMLLRKKENKSEDISAEPLSKEAHEKLKTLWIKQKLILKLIKEVSVYVLFAVATFIAVHGHRSPLAYYGTKTAKDVFVRGHYTHSMPLKNVRNFKDVITFINHTLIPSLHMDHRYNKDNINSLGFTVDCVSKLVGVPRLRQLRVKPVLHSGNSDVEDVLGKYSLSYSWNNEDTTDYLIGWKTARNTNEIERTAVNPWIWQSSKELSTLPTTGKDKAASILDDVTSKLIEEGNSKSISSKEFLDVSKVHPVYDDRGFPSGHFNSVIAQKSMSDAYSILTERSLHSPHSSCLKYAISKHEI